MRALALIGALALVATIAVGCTTVDTTRRPGDAPGTPVATDAATFLPEATAVETPAPTATPEPPLSLAPPGATDPRPISVTVVPEVAPDAGGQITVTVTSQASELIDELVLRWPSDLSQTLVLAPFVPDPDLVRDGGGNLVVTWTKWVLGPGEQGEPPGTISLGYGPLDAGATLSIPIYVTRLAPGPTSFDMQILAGESLLTLPDGQPAELRVEVP